MLMSNSIITIQNSNTNTNIVRPTTRGRCEKRKSTPFLTPSPKIIRRSGPGADENVATTTANNNSNSSKVCITGERKNESRPSPLPQITFADGTRVWDLMCRMDTQYKRSFSIFNNHPVISPQMRAILLDWIMDVCEAYNLHRETLYLAIDYLDRYLALETNIGKEHLQLIGISCLFIAAKLEEIFPPKLATFAYVTDGACTAQHILDTEVVIMKTLEWKLTPVTPGTWINVYLQVLEIHNSKANISGSPGSTRTSPRRKISLKPRSMKTDPNSKLLQRNFNGTDYVRACRILDLATLDAKSVNFSYSLLAAASIFHIKGQAAALVSSGLSWDAIAPCVNWMAPFAMVVRHHDIPEVLPSIKDVAEENRHLIQTHCITLGMLEKALQIQESSKVLSPLPHTDGLLTPPRSSDKYLRERSKR